MNIWCWNSKDIKHVFNVGLKWVKLVIYLTADGTDLWQDLSTGVSDFLFNKMRFKK
jgi:hypothetical protein